jgi:hypothetical protein
MQANQSTQAGERTLQSWLEDKASRRPVKGKRNDATRSEIKKNNEILKSLRARNKNDEGPGTQYMGDV